MKILIAALAMISTTAFAETEDAPQVKDCSGISQKWVAAQAVRLVATLEDGRLKDDPIIKNGPKDSGFRADSAWLSNNPERCSIIVNVHYVRFQRVYSRTVSYYADKSFSIDAQEMVDAD